MFSERFKKNVYDFKLGVTEYKNIMNLLQRKAPFLKTKMFTDEQSAETTYGDDIVYIGSGYYDSWGEEDIKQHINVIFFMELMDCLILDYDTYSEPYQKLIKDIYKQKNFDKIVKKDIKNLIKNRI